MRIVKKLQQALREEKVKIGQGAELEEVSRILEECPGMNEVYRSILRDVSGKANSRLGREGLSASEDLEAWAIEEAPWIELPWAFRRDAGFTVSTAVS